MSNYNIILYNNAFKSYLQEIANAIKIKTGAAAYSDLDNEDVIKIPFNKFCDEIKSIDRLQKSTLYPNGLDNTNSKNLQKVLSAAQSYYDMAHSNTGNPFKYNSDIGPLLGYNLIEDKSDNKKMIDCSTYVSLCLRNINYEASPYNYKNNNLPSLNTDYEYPAGSGNKYVKWLRKNIVNLYPQDWIFRYLDYQPENEFNNFGISGCSSIRNAAQIGEFFYKYGYVVFDAKKEGSIENLEAAQLVANKLQPGDLIFWSKSGATPAQKTRFRSISHCAIMVDSEKYYEVTSSSEVVQSEKFLENWGSISLVCRPNYA